MVPLSFVQKNALCRVQIIRAALITGTVPVPSYSLVLSVEPSGVHSLFLYAPLSHYQRLPLPHVEGDTTLRHRFHLDLSQV